MLETKLIPRMAASRKSAVAVSLALGLVLTTTLAFPPAPHHTLYGLVRNQWGDPINVTSAEVLIETSASSSLSVGIVPAVEPGLNYRMFVPMDSGATLDLYKPTALRNTMPFRMRVKVGTTTYLPLEMAGSLPQIGSPSDSTRLDLTLGVDSDGDGLPDAWEQALIAIYGGTLATINPNDDSDGDGISNLNEYLAGTYAFDPTDGFRLSVMGVNTGNSLIEFLAIRGRTYAIQTSSDLQQWIPASFRVISAGQPGAPQDNYFATDVRFLQVEVPLQVGGQTNQYFRATVR